MTATPEKTCAPPSYRQMSLFDSGENTSPQRHSASHNGTETSRSAADSMASVASGLRADVLNHIRSCGDHGATANEIQRALEMRPETCSTRCNELRRAGLIYRDGRKRPTESGRLVYVCTATSKGREASP
jgi:hypothetical protein